jgi:hypothetical protein
MKRILAMLVLALGLPAAGQESPPPPPQTPASTIPVDEANVRQARELLDGMIAALGGDAYLNVQDREEQGRFYGFYQGEPRGTGAPYWRFWKWPDKERSEMWRQRNWIILYAGDQGWETTFRGTRKHNKDEIADYVERRHYSLENVLRVWLHQPGTALFYEGKAVSDQRAVERVTVMNAAYEAVTLHIDAESFLPVRKTRAVRDPETGQRIEEAEVWDNYRVVQGVNTPHNYTRYRNGMMVFQRFMRNVRYNTGVPESLFAAPRVTMTDGRR